MTAIEYKSVYKSYGDSPAVEDFNLQVGRGEFVTVIGSSGCGKTTVLKMANGLVRPDSGEVYVDGKAVGETDLTELRRSIGYSIQGSVLFPHMTVEKNISYVPDLLNKKDKERTRRAVDKWMDIVGLDYGLKQRYPSELSGGQQQRVGIARALAASPDILLMDEPFGAVDGITRAQLQTEIKRIHEKTGITVLFVTHDIEEALRLGTKTLVMNNGRAEQYDVPSELIKRPATPFAERLVNRSAL